MQSTPKSPMGEVGFSLGGYLVLQRLAVGGMGEIYLAKRKGPQGFEKTVALKRLLPQYARDIHFSTMFLDEARLAAKLTHPHIVQIFDLGEDQGAYFIAMEFLVGETLAALIRKLIHLELRMPADVVALIGSQAADALHYAHTLKGGDGRLLHIVHRDISPQNIMLTRQGHVKVIDFGIARALGRSQKTETGVVKGKLSYLAPEVLAGRVADARSDVYALGVTLHEALLGQHMVPRGLEYSDLRKYLDENQPSLERSDPNLPASLCTIVDKASALDPTARFQTGAELQEALLDYLHASGNRTSADHLARLLASSFGPQYFDEIENVTRTPTEVSTARGGRPTPVVAIEDAIVVSAGSSRRSVWPWAILGAMVLLVLGWGLGWGLRTRRGGTAVETVDLTTTSTATKNLVVPAATPSSDPPSKEPAAVEGTLALSSNVSAEVLWRGRSLGRTPIEYAALPPGQQQLRLVNKGEALDTQVVVQIRAGQHLQRHVALRRGTLSVNATPWANLTLGEKALGQTPAYDISLWEGEYALTLENPELGVKKRVQVRVRPGQTTHIHETF